MAAAFSACCMLTAGSKQCCCLPRCSPHSRLHATLGRTPCNLQRSSGSCLPSFTLSSFCSPSVRLAAHARIYKEDANTPFVM
jgi:hypothetical protein